MEHGLDFQELRYLMMTSAATIGLSLESRPLDRFMTYIQVLIRWNKKINLTGIDNPKDIIIKHFIDSLAGLNACDIPINSIMIDIGAGAGFPGIPLKIVREDLQLILVEPAHKKSSFLKSLIGLLKLDRTSTFDGTVQDYVNLPNRTRADFVVVRAVKFNAIKPSMKGLLRQQGLVMLYRTEPIDPGELESDFALRKELSFALPYGYGHRVISVVEIGKTV